MDVFSNATDALKETILAAAVTGTTAINTTTAVAVATGTGGLFHDFSSTLYYGMQPSSRRQPVVLYDDAGTIYEEAHITARTGDTITLFRSSPDGNSVTFPTLPIGTKIAPILSARGLSKFVQDSDVVSVSDGYKVTPDAGITPAGKAYHVNIGKNSLVTKQQGVALGPFARCMVESGFSISGFPTIANDGEARGFEQAFSGMESLFSTISMSLTGGINWAASTLYDTGTVFKADPDDGLQYTLYCNSWGGNQTQATSTAVEPAWVGLDWDYTDMDITLVHTSDFAYLLSTDWEGVGYEVWFPEGVTFFPSEFIFVCDKLDTLTVDAVVTISSGATVFVNAQAVSGLTGAHQIKRFPVTSNAGVRGYAGAPGLKIHLDTPAVANKLEGRWLVKGFFIENMFNTPLTNYAGS